MPSAGDVCHTSPGRRTQLYLDEEMIRLLAAESRRRGTTMAALVRDAVAQGYGRARPNERSAIINRQAGMWGDRSDLGSTALADRSLRESGCIDRQVSTGGAIVQ